MQEQVTQTNTEKLMIHIIRRERFNAAHRLFRPDWDDSQNEKVFGKCSNPNWHGHNYELMINVKGEINKETGFVVNLKTLSTIIKTVIIDKVDHKNLNIDVDFLKDKIPSSEVLAVAIWNELKKPIEELGIELHCVRISETENNYIEYFG